MLATLGEETIAVIKNNLSRSYAISFVVDDDSKFLLDQLHFGLSVMMGESSANNILSQITREIDNILLEQMH